MIPKEAIEKAVEGGWKDNSVYYGIGYASQTALDPTFWQALGKALGWKGAEQEMGCLWRPGEVEGVVYGLVDRGTPTYYAHLFYDLILTGGSTTEFWDELLK